MHYIGLDIHKKHTQACVMDETGKVTLNLMIARRQAFHAR